MIVLLSRFFVLRKLEVERKKKIASALIEYVHLTWLGIFTVICVSNILHFYYDSPLAHVTLLSRQNKPQPRSSSK